MEKLNMEAELSKAIEARALDDIQYLQTNIGQMNRLREENSGDWEIEELTRAIIHDEAQIIESLKGEIELAREARKEFERLQRGGPNHFLSGNVSQAKGDSRKHSSGEKLYSLPGYSG